MQARDVTAGTRQVAIEARSTADEAEALRTMPSGLVGTARAAGLFRMAMPAALGGLELDPASIVAAVEEVSAADGSAGWTVLIGNSTAFLAWLEPTTAKELLDGAVDVVSTSMFAPLGRARREGDDLVIDGRWPFNSGCVHADWYQAGVVVLDGDGPAHRPDGGIDTRFATFPRQAARIIDTWHSTGLRGTGSHDIEVDGAPDPRGAHRRADARSRGSDRRTLGARVLPTPRRAHERFPTRCRPTRAQRAHHARPHEATREQPHHPRRRRPRPVRPRARRSGGAERTVVRPRRDR